MHLGHFLSISPFAIAFACSPASPSTCFDLHFGFKQNSCGFFLALIAVTIGKPHVSQTLSLGFIKALFGRENVVLQSGYLSQAAKLPNLLLNGSVGIAVGMTTNIPPHNLGELVDAILYLADHSDATVDDLTKFVKGPDFPTGGIMFDEKAIRRHLESLGIAVGEVASRIGAEGAGPSIYLSDPEGNVVELKGPPSKQ